MGSKFKMAAKLLLFMIQFWYWICRIFDLKVEYHIKNEQTNIQIDGRYVTNSSSKTLIHI